jgi:23S rRNA (pseudouridine1915-N3)-methyltransferase
MRTTLLAVGRIKAPFLAAEAHYRKLLSRHYPVEVVEVRSPAELARRLPAGVRVVALDSGGREMDSIGWSRWLEGRRLEARDVCLILGGPEGLPADILAKAEERISLGRQTMAHQLARIVLLEQLFRAVKILAGEAYHR